MAEPGAGEEIQSHLAEIVAGSQRLGREFQSPQLTSRLQRKSRPGAGWRDHAVLELRAGGASFSGSGTFATDNFSTSGKLSLRGVNYDDQSFAIKDANATAEFSLDQEHILLKKIDARMLRGMVTGDAEVRHYAPSLEVTTAKVSSERPAEGAKSSASTPASAKTEAGAKLVELPVQQGSARLNVSRVSLTEVVRMLSSKALPLDQLNATGVVNGTINLAWRESITAGSRRWPWIRRCRHNTRPINCR